MKKIYNIGGKVVKLETKVYNRNKKTYDKLGIPHGQMVEVKDQPAISDEEE